MVDRCVRAVKKGCVLRFGSFFSSFACRKESNRMVAIELVMVFFLVGG